MSTLQTRFGEVEYDAKNLLHFREGMIGLPDLHDFIVMPNRKEGPLFWIQSVDNPDFAFVLTDPTNFFFDYRIVPDSSVKLALQIEEEDPCFVLTVVTVPPDQNITINLAAPIFFASKSNRAMQVILDNTNYQIKTPLPNTKKA